MKTILRFVLGALCAMMLSGCTYRLWTTDNFRHFRYPSPDPKLVVFHDWQRDEFIACYDELSDKRGTVERRAYLVRANSDVGERGRAPQFLPMATFNLPSLPVNPTNPSSPYATETNNVFTIHTASEVIGPRRLPSYLESTGVPAKIALTPLAIVADVAVVGVVVGLLTPGLWVNVASP